MAAQENAIERALVALGIMKPTERAIEARSSRRGSALLAGRRPTEAAGAYDHAYTLWNMVGRRTAQREAPLRMLRYIRDYDPDAAMAVWSFIRMVTRIEDIHVYQNGAGQDNEEIDEEGQAMIDKLNDPTAAAVAREYGGGLANLAAVFTLTLLTQGAIAVEVALTKNLKDILGFFPVDPSIIDFQYDDMRVPHPVINQMGAPTPINELQFRYVPMDPDVEDPHGRAPFWPAFETIQFKTEVMRDLKAVAHNQGHARIDVKVVEEIMLENLQKVRPDLFRPGQESGLQDELDDYLSDLQTSYNSLNPDDAFIHWDAIEVGSAGADHRGSLDIASLIDAIDRQVVASLKVLPLMLGRNEGSTTTHATVQWQIFAQTVEAIQEKIEAALEWACNLALQVWGRQSRCEIVFEAPRKSDRYQDVQADKMETETWIMRVAQGWANDEEAAMEVLGHAPTGEKAPPVVPVIAAGDADDDEDDGGEPMDDKAKEVEPRVLGRALRDELRRQIGDEPFGDEASELLLTPNWMQYLVRRADQELSIPDRMHFQQAYNALLAVPDEEWEAAVEADKAAGRQGDNGHGHER